MPGPAGPAAGGPALPATPLLPYQAGTMQLAAPPVAGGLAPVLHRIPTNLPVVFVTIDDGAVRDPHALDLITRSGAHPTLFLTNRYVHEHEDYFRALQKAGAMIEDHTLTHPDLKGKPYPMQHDEICKTADDYAAAFGTRPVLFRPPFGASDATTQRAAADCGMRAVIDWTAAVNDGHVQFQAGTKLKPGDIVLMHFRPTFVADYTALITQAAKDGLSPAPLLDFLG